MPTRWWCYRLFLLLLLLLFHGAMPTPTTFSARLIHRFSLEMKALRLSTRNNASASIPWPERSSAHYYDTLLANDFVRHKMKLGSRFQLLFPSRGSKTMSFGNEFAWLHYTWIDIGTPSTSFLVALDTGSDLLWVPCDCIQCAPLSYANLDSNLNEYHPSRSISSKHLSCGHKLCKMGSTCKSSKQQCPYTSNYSSENTSSSGLLVEDILHLASGGGGRSNSSAQVPVVIGCGMKQSGVYLDGAAPDGVMGLGLQEISVPSFLAKSGLIHDSFSVCFNEDGSGRIFFGDQGPPIQQSTAFLPSDGIYSTYIVGVEAFCVLNSCPKMASFKAQVDSGTSFTLLPRHVYKAIAGEFDQLINASRSTVDGWDYCYTSSSQDLPKVPTLTLMFQQNNSFVVYNPVVVLQGYQGIIGFCLAIQPIDGDTGTIGQNFMTGYRLVFDRENKKLGWSRSSLYLSLKFNSNTLSSKETPIPRPMLPLANIQVKTPSSPHSPAVMSSLCQHVCVGQDLSLGKRMPLSPPNEAAVKPLPTDQQQRTNGRAVAPAVAGRAPHKRSAASSRMISCWHHWRWLFLLFLIVPVF